MAAPLFVAGRGNLGRSLAPALAQAGYDVTLIPARSGMRRLVRLLKSRPDAIVFLCVPDRVVAEFAAKLVAAGKAVPSTVAFVHVSGALGLGPLGPLAHRQPVGSFHPLQSFPAPRPPQAFQGIVVAVDAASVPLLRRLERLARGLGSRPRRVTESQRVLYHTAAVIASNYLVAIADQAVDLLKQIGWSKREALRGLLPLMEGALAQTAKRGPTAALTGPIRRGDAETVERHLVALEAGGFSRPDGPSVADVYRMLGTIALEMASDAGLEPAKADRVRRALTHNAAATRRRGRQ